MQPKLLLSILFLFQLSAFSQPTIQWQKCLGGTNVDEASSIQQTTDGGYIVAGYTLSNDGDVSGKHDSTDIWVVKLNGSGGIQWQKCLGGKGDDEANSIQQTNDGGYIVAGFTTSNDGDVSGNHDSTGHSDDYWVVKLNGNGVVQWQKCLGGSSFDYARCIQQTIDGGYIIAGKSNSNDDDVSGNHGGDYWVVKLNDIGGIQWQKCLGGTNFDLAVSIQQTTDKGYIVAGYTFSNDGDVSGNHDTTGTYADYWIVKLDSGGIIQWQKCLGGTNEDVAHSIRQTNDGGYIVAGQSQSNDGDVVGNIFPAPYWIIKLNGSGIIQWQKTYGGSGGEGASSIQQTTDGGYIVAGYSGSNDGNVSGNHGGGDYWIVKLSPYNGINEPDAMENVFHIYPNPLSSASTLQLNTQLKNAEVVIYDIVGKELMRKKLTGDRMEIEKGALERGVYFVSVRSEERQWVEKLIIE